MSLIRCAKCQQSFDATLLSAGLPLCPYCGHQNESPLAPPVAPVPSPQQASPSTSVTASAPANQARSACEWESDWLTNPLGAYLSTAKNIFLDPVYSFDRIRPFENLTSLIVLMYINFFVVMLGVFALATIMKLAEGSVEFFKTAPEWSFALPFFSMETGVFLIIGTFMLFFVPIVQVLVTLLFALFVHLFLGFLGGSQKDYAATLTVYGLGTMLNWAALLVLVPFAGPFLHALVRLAYFVLVYIFGMARLHEISAGKVLLSYLVPLLICCCCFGALGVAVPMLLASLTK